MARQRKSDLWNEKKPRFRKAKKPLDYAVAQWRGYWDQDDTSQYVHNNIEEVIGSTLKHLGLKNRFDEDQMLLAWNEIVGDFVAENSRPIEVKHRILVVQVLQPAVHYQLERMKGEILGRMQKRFGARNIRGLRFQIG